MPQFIERTHFNLHTISSLKTSDDPAQVRTLLFPASTLQIHDTLKQKWLHSIAGY